MSQATSSAARRLTRRRDLVALFLLTALAVGIAEGFRGSSVHLADEMRVASLAMEEATHLMADHRTVHGPPIDPRYDIHKTGLIGTLFSPTTTTVGNLEAKRTTTNPNAAGLVVYLLQASGVRNGDYIAIGASGSFPALILATLCAAKAMSLDAALIVSLGSSQWGANHPTFTWLDMEAVLARAGFLPDDLRTRAASLGGSDDRASDLSPEGREVLAESIRAYGVDLIDSADLAENVALRVAVYRREARGKRIAAFVSIGGSWANLGTSSAVLSLSPGVPDVQAFPAESTWGVLHTLAADGVSILHLLNVADLAQEYGLPWDPSPLPAAGEPMLRDASSTASLGLAMASSVYALGLAIWLGTTRARRSKLARL